MAATAHCGACFSIPNFRSQRTINSQLGPNFIKPVSASKKTTTVAISRLRFSQAAPVPRRPVFRVWVVSNSFPEADPSDSSAAHEGPIFDIKLPRRSLLVQFTCDKCGERTERLINRLAYERGLVYVQCAGCERHHKLVDNLGLVVEHDLREETSAESDEVS
ncbi:mitochondrial protein import protein ZIM17-like [Tripterygium wilfordii]|uniref:Mitochondrial protein import protein ZIM17-like n=1 Tax=Tripterygium wilfordii TaxID=458696 RepID=A0A7J7C101_TRIWF|nr:mitochondrial protein import protein ZIM17 [Tripterygium wilfordii]XP_038694304.1 mitochondrial protein import protein ZIM17 [Tripterygium wilfordii]KAF5727778.1 mitochondrial protein import protein ZIM17-like [Tripterygium wilfordii]